MKKTPVAVIIPARYASTRFPGKPLALLAGKPMIQHVWEKAIASKDAKALKSYKNESENGLKLELVYSDDFSIARYRLYRYIPFEFQPDSEIIELNAEQVKVLTQL